MTANQQIEIAELKTQLKVALEVAKTLAWSQLYDSINCIEECIDDPYGSWILQKDSWRSRVDFVETQVTRLGTDFKKLEKSVYAELDYEQCEKCLKMVSSYIIFVVNEKRICDNCFSDGENED